MYHRLSRHLSMSGLALVFLLIGSAWFSGSTHVHAQGQTYYVATNGSDTNPGTLTSPFLTIQKCASIAVAGDTCIIRAGTYHETVTPTNSGTAGNPITFQPYQGEPVTIDGADSVTGWTQYQGSIYQAKVSINPNLFANQVFVDGTMMLDARWPNTGLDPLHPTLATAGPGTTSQNIVDPALTQPAGFWNGATIHTWGYDAWAAQTGTVTSSEPGQLAFTGANKGYLSLLMGPDNRYYLSGVLNALDQPTEWFYNAGTSTLYLWTPDGKSPDQHTVEVKQRLNAFDLSGRSYITVTGLNIFASTIVTDTNSSNDTLDSLTARYISQTDAILPGSGDFDVLQSHVSDTGIQLYGSNNTLSNSDIGWSSGTGVYLSGTNQTVTNNLIHDIDYTSTYSPPVSINGDYMTITHNTIYRTARDAIGGGNFTHATISYNDIFNANMLTRDNGTIYFCCQFQSTGTRIDHNYIHDSQVDAYNTLAQTYGFNASGIYLDNSTGGVQVDHNVIWNTGSFGINLNGAAVSNPTSTGNLIYNNTVGSTSYKSMDACSCDFTGTQVINNIFVGSSPSSLTNGTVSHNLTSGTDPKFVNAAQHDFHLQAGSPAIDAGQAIPGVTDGYAGSAPDEGAYEYGGTDWTAGSTLDTGVLAFPTVSTDATGGNGHVVVSWDAVNHATGYKVKYGTTRDNYDHVVDVGNTTSYTFTGLTGDEPYYFSVSAYNAQGESANATEAVDFLRGIARSATDTIYAGSYDAITFAVNNTTYVNWINYSSDNNWLEYKSVNFGSGVSTFLAYLAAPPSAAGKQIEVHLDSTTGPLISTLTLQQTTSSTPDYNGSFAIQTAPVSGATGTHDVYLVFKGQGDSFLGLLSLASFTFVQPVLTIDDSVQGSGQNQFNYSGNWGHCLGTAQCGDPAGFLYNDSNSWDNTTNDAVTLTFTGTGINFYGVKDPRHGIGAISIDGGSETNVDFYAATRAGDQLLWSSPTLPAGSHTFKLRVTGTHDSNSSDSYVTVDRVDILSAASQQQPTNLALNGTASASSTYGSGWEAARAIDNNIATGWSASSNDTAPWWEVDLGSAHTLTQIQLVTRQDVDQPETRQNFVVWASNNADMSQGHVVLGSQGGTVLPYQSTWTLNVTDTTPYRYVAVVKTDDAYFFIAELRVLGN